MERDRSSQLEITVPFDKEIFKILIVNFGLMDRTHDLYFARGRPFRRFRRQHGIGDIGKWQ